MPTTTKTLCEVCGDETDQSTRCTNQRCLACHDAHCTDGGNDSPGHGRGDVPTMTTMEELEPTLADAQRIVDGYVQMLQLPNGDQLLMNEDGRRLQLTPNKAATVLVQGLFGDNGDANTIRGNTILLKELARWK